MPVIEESGPRLAWLPTTELRDLLESRRASMPTEEEFNRAYNFFWAREAATTLRRVNADRAKLGLGGVLCDFCGRDAVAECPDCEAFVCEEHQEHTCLPDE